MSMLDLILAHAPRSAMARQLADVALPRVECFYFGHVKWSGHVFCSHHGGVEHATEREASAALGRGGLDTRLCWNGPKTDLACDLASGARWRRVKKPLLDRLFRNATAMVGNLHGDVPR